MKNKKKDEVYCGVDRDKILGASPQLDWEAVHHFKDFVLDRYRIHKRKDVKGLPAPWTKNPILQEFKFTNVRREHDRQTRYLIENISTNPDLTLEDKIVNTFLFRAWNNWDTLKDFGFPYPAVELYNPDFKDSVRSIYKLLSGYNPKRLWYNNAYNQGGTKQSWKYLDPENKRGLEKEMPLRPFHVGVWLGIQDIPERLLEAKDQQECFDIIKSIRGFADFLAYQVFVDLTYIEEFPFSENEFVIAGPGCKRGLDHIFIDKDGMTYEECIFWLRNRINTEKLADSLFNCEELENWSKFEQKFNPVYDPMLLFSDLPSYDRQTNVMSIENCMCELSKYIKAVKGTGRPRNKYKPFKED